MLCFSNIQVLANSTKFSIKIFKTQKNKQSFRVSQWSNYTLNWDKKLVPTMATMAINQLTILAMLLFEKYVKSKMLI